MVSHLTRDRVFGCCRKRFRVELLLFQATNTQSKAATKHGKSAEVNLRVAMGVGVILFQNKVALIVKQTIQYIGCIIVVKNLGQKLRSKRSLCLVKCAKSDIFRPIIAIFCDYVNQEAGIGDVPKPP